MTDTRTELKKLITNEELKELIEERIEAGEISIIKEHEQGGIEVENSQNERIYIKVNEPTKEEEKNETYTDRFLRKTGIKKDKDGNPDIVGHVLGNYHKSIRKAHEATTGKTCEQCKEAIGLYTTYTERQLKGSDQVF